MRANRLKVARPPRRALRRPWRDVEFAALDFEATGLDFARDTIVSFGVLPVRAGRVVLGEGVHQLIDPHVPPSPRSQTIHQLRPMDLAGSPRLSEARGLLRDSLQHRFLLVWFASVEVNFLAAIFGGTSASWSRRTIDVRNLAIAADGVSVKARTQPGYSLSWSAERLHVPVADPHSAFDDALVTAQVFLALAGRLPAGPEPTVAELFYLAGHGTAPYS
jgi:DNA polymerase III subunit epsilon